jgi:hypothetical protein
MSPYAGQRNKLFHLLLSFLFCPYNGTLTNMKIFFYILKGWMEVGEVGAEHFLP